MKYAKSTMFYLIASLFAVLAVTFAPMASAADLPGSFKATTLNGTAVTFTTHRMASFECVGGQVNTVRVDSDQKYYIDTAGTLCTQLKSVPGFVGKWVKQAGAERYFQAIWDNTQCYSGQSMLNYNYGLLVNDGCQLDADIKNKSN